MIVYQSALERRRWEAMSEVEQERYAGMADYLQSEYGSEQVTLADIDTALAIGA